MELQEILEYTKNNWEEIKDKIKNEGHPDAFYFILLPEYDDHRFIDPTLPAIGSSTSGAWRGNITNPGIGQFYGLKLEERLEEDTEETKRRDEDNELSHQFVKVTFLYEGEICQGTFEKEMIIDNPKLTKYTAWGIYKKITSEYVPPSSEAIYNMYTELNDFLASETTQQKSWTLGKHQLREYQTTKNKSNMLKATQNLTKAIHINPRNNILPQILHCLIKEGYMESLTTCAKILRDRQEWEEAKEIFAFLTLLQPENHNHHYFLATIYEQKKQFEHALTEYKLAGEGSSAKTGLARVEQELSFRIK